MTKPIPWSVSWNHLTSSSSLGNRSWNSVQEIAGFFEPFSIGMTENPAETQARAMARTSLFIRLGLGFLGFFLGFERITDEIAQVLRHEQSPFIRGFLDAPVNRFREPYRQDFRHVLPLQEEAKESI